jgi:hypothetical protein
MTEHVRADEDDPVHSLLECATNGGYHLDTRLHSRLSLSSHPEPGIAATTGDPTVPTNVYTGPCLMSSVDSTALAKGYDPTTYDPETDTGETLQDYEQFADFLLDGGVPKLSQIIDHWGIQDMDDGTVVLVLEDEEWTDKVERALSDAGVAFDHERVFEDVRTAYGTHLKDVFAAYVRDLLDNDVEIVPVFTSEHSEEIDRLLDEATERSDVQSGYADSDHYFQRIAMYTTPIWLDYLETELGLEAGSLDITDPARFYDEFYNYEGSERNIFRRYQLEYFAADNDGRAHDLLFVPPVLAPFGEGYTLESHAAHHDSITPMRLDDVLSRLAASKRETYPNLLETPLARLLTGFPNRSELAVHLIRTWETESERRPDWKTEAVEAVTGAVRDDTEVQRESGVRISSEVQEHREEVRIDGSSGSIVDHLYEALADDLHTVLERGTA